MYKRQGLEEMQAGSGVKQDQCVELRRVETGSRKVTKNAIDLVRRQTNCYLLFDSYYFQQITFHWKQQTTIVLIVVKIVVIFNESLVSK